ncbi:MAG: endonuclease [Bacteroidales bacterium]|nr:endonuclease [Bacteroidales bacterium]
MISKRYVFLAIIFSIILNNILGQNKNTPPIDTNSIRVVFYNLENFFDSFDDTLTNDDEFTPFGEKHWTWKRFVEKKLKISKVLLNIGEWNMPGIIGLCELENKFVLQQLLFNSSLKSFNYNIIHNDSPDLRGIDVALVYNQDVFVPIQTNFINIVFSFDSTIKTRDILYAKGVLNKTDTLHIFVNHWPSRYGGYLKTVSKRNYVAKVLREKIDSIQLENQAANIIIMGDFNDEPKDESLSKILKARIAGSEFKTKDLINLMTFKKKDQIEGTIKYRESWNTFDQFIISYSLLNKENLLYIEPMKKNIFDAAYLLEYDNTYLGNKPFRTYSGPKFNDGFSDHLPIYMDIYIK